MIAQYDSLEFLRFASYFEDRHQDKDALPSCVADWNVLRCVQNGMGYARASDSMVALYDAVSDDGLRLRVQVCRLSRAISDDPPYDVISESAQWMIDKLETLSKRDPSSP